MIVLTGQVAETVHHLYNGVPVNEIHLEMGLAKPTVRAHLQAAHRTAGIWGEWNRNIRLCWLVSKGEVVLE